MANWDSTEGFLFTLPDLRNLRQSNYKVNTVLTLSRTTPATLFHFAKRHGTGTAAPFRISTRNASSAPAALVIRTLMRWVPASSSSV